MSEGRSRRVVIFITTSTIALSAYASPASSAVFPAYESCRKYPDTRNAEGTLAIIAAVLRPEKTSLKPSNRAVRRKYGVSCGSAAIRPAVAPVTTRVGSQCLIAADPHD